MSLGGTSAMESNSSNLTKADKQTLLAIMELCKKGLEKCEERETEKARLEKKMRKVKEELDVDMTL